MSQGRLAHRPDRHGRLIPFLAAAAVAIAFAHLGAMSVQISILTAFHKVMAVAPLISVAVAVVAMILRGRKPSE